MTFGAEVWGPPLIQAAGSVASGYLAGKGKAGNETKLQRTQRKLIDQLLASLSGNGPYADLFKTDQEAFNKSFVEPAQSMFRNRIAPQIQQQYIASGQQRGTGLDDQLLRAGVDLDALLNQHYLDYMNRANDRKQNIIGNILGAGTGAANNTSTNQDIMSSLSGYLSSQGFADSTANLFKSNQSKSTSSAVTGARKGYEAGY